MTPATSPDLAGVPRSRAAIRVLVGALRRGGGDRRRSLWTAAAVAGATALTCGAVSIAALADAEPGCTTELVDVEGTLQGALSCPARASGLAPFLVEPGLRVGVVVGALFLVVPFALFAVQAIRFGTAARERRLAAFVVAGAGRSELRRIGGREAARPAAVGAWLGLPLYLVLWVLLGQALPFGWRMLPASPWWGLAAWPAAALLMVGFAAVSGARAARPAALTPVGLVRRGPRPVTWPEVIRPVVLLAAVVGIAVPAFGGYVPRGVAGLRVWAALGCLLAAAVTAGTPLAALVGRLLVRRSSPVRVLAGRRLLADPRTPGRVGGVMLGVGLAVGVEAVGVVDVMATGSEFDDGRPFYLVGFGAAFLATLVAAAVAMGALVVGAAEQLRDTARPTAALVALGAARGDVQAVTALWLRAAAVLPGLVGAVLGWVLYLPAALRVDAGSLRLAGAGRSLGLAVVVLWVVVAVGGRVAARLLRTAVDGSMAIENLRTG